jgi:hypothetical protein
MLLKNTGRACKRTFCGCSTMPLPLVFISLRKLHGSTIVQCPAEWTSADYRYRVPVPYFLQIIYDLHAFNTVSYVGR